MSPTTANRPGILTVREARSTLPSLVKRAELQREEIRLGGRGADQVTLIASVALRELKALAQIGQQALAGRLPVIDPWAAIQGAVADGRLAADGNFARAYHARADEREARSLAEMAASGMADTTAPEFRRRFTEEVPARPTEPASSGAGRSARARHTRKRG